MASASILFIGVFVVWCLAAVGGGWPLPLLIGGGAVASALVVALAQRLRVVDREGVASYARLASTAALVVARTPARAFDAVRVLAGVVGAREKAPVFVRLKLKPADSLGAATVIAAMSSAPGTLVVDADAGSLLAHVMVENDVDVAAMQALERAALASAGSVS